MGGAKMKWIVIVLCVATVVFSLFVFGFFAVFAAKAHDRKTSDLQENIRVEGIKKAEELGRKPVIITMGDNGKISFLPGSEFTIGDGESALTGDDLVVNAGEEPQTVLNTTLNQGEFGIVTKDGTCNKLPGILGGALAKTTVDGKSAADSSKIRVKGVLVDTDGKPIKGASVAVYEGDADGYKLKTKPDPEKPDMAIIINPRAESNAAGEFTVEWERDLFGDVQDFVVLADMKPTQSQKTGKPTTLKIDSKSKDIDVGELTWAK